MSDCPIGPACPMAGMHRAEDEMGLEFNAPGIDKPNRGAWPTDIRDPDDEMVATGFIHVERMDDNTWWLGIYTADGRCVHINFWTKRAKIYSSMEDQGEDRLWQDRMDSAPAAEAGRAEGQPSWWRCDDYNHFFAEGAERCVCGKRSASQTGTEGQEGGALKAECADCGRPYGDEHGFPDLVVPHDIWNRISPSGNEGGLLCPSCICKRLYDAGIQTTGAFRSGPLVSSPEDALCGTGGCTLSKGHEGTYRHARGALRPRADCHICQKPLRCANCHTEQADYWPDLEETAARLRAAEALIAKWRAEEEEYPKTDCGPYAAAVLRLCADELEAALTGQEPDPQDYEYEHREMNR